MKINRTTQRTVQILKLISSRQEGITLDEICEILQIPKTSGYDIITTLVSMGMVNLTKGQKQKYSIGLAAYRIGINYTNNMDFLGIIEPVLKDFAKEMKKTVFFGVPSDYEIVYISKYEPDNPIITTATVGMKNPMYCTSLGKAILAYMNDQDREQIVTHIKYKPRTEFTITARQKLETELEKIRNLGYAVDFRELEEHMVCVGAPVYDRDSNVSGAISVSGLYREQEDYAAIGRKVKNKAEEISKLLGFLKPRSGDGK